MRLGIGRLIWLWVFATLAGVSIGQVAPSRNDPALPKAYLRQPAFVIPFQVDPVVESPIEVQLYVSVDGGENWRLAGREVPNAERFAYRSDSDGIFWFASKTISRQSPSPQTTNLTPELLVVVDTTQPQFDVQVTSPRAGQIQATWSAFDPNLDPSTLQLEFRLNSDSAWQPVGIDVPESSVEQNRYQGRVSWAVPIAGAVIHTRAAIRDYSGNLTAVNRRIALTPNRQQTAQTTAATTQPPQNSQPANRFTPGGLTNQNSGEVWQADNHAVRGSSKPLSNQFTRPNSSGQSSQRNFAFGGSVPQDPFQRQQMFQNASLPQAGSKRPQRPSLNSRSDPQHDPNVNSFTPQQLDPLVPQQIDALPQSNPALLLGQSDSGNMDTNQTASSQPPSPSDTKTDDNVRPVYGKFRRFQLDYGVEALGSGSIDEAQLWMTSDGGRTWNMWGKDPDRQSPVDVEVTEDGLYGFRVVIVSDNGLSGPRPNSGEPADIWVAVDSRAPLVRFIGTANGQGIQTGQLVIRWQAEDAHLPPRPIKLSYAATSQGPWHVIAKDLANTGEYTWRPGPAIPKKVFLRVVVRDEAGNENQAMNVTAVDLTGLAPRGRIRSVHEIR